MKSKIAFGVLSLLVSVRAMSFPYLVSKDYAYSQTLPVKISTMLHPTSGSNSKDFTFNSYTDLDSSTYTVDQKKNIAKNSAKYMHNAANPFIPFKKNLPVCFFPEEDEVTKA